MEDSTAGGVKKGSVVKRVPMTLGISLSEATARTNAGFVNAVMADLFPLGLAATTLVILVLTYVTLRFPCKSSFDQSYRFVLDIVIQNISTARPAVEVCVLYVLSIVWLGTYARHSL